jgi:hypothetical protein
MTEEAESMKTAMSDNLEQIREQSMMEFDDVDDLNPSENSKRNPRSIDMS